MKTPIIFLLTLIFGTFSGLIAQSKELKRNMENQNIYYLDFVNNQNAADNYFFDSSHAQGVAHLILGNNNFGQALIGFNIANLLQNLNPVIFPQGNSTVPQVILNCQQNILQYITPTIIAFQNQIVLQAIANTPQIIGRVCYAVVYNQT